MARKSADAAGCDVSYGVNSATSYHKFLNVFIEMQ